SRFNGCTMRILQPSWLGAFCVATTSSTTLPMSMFFDQKLLYCLTLYFSQSDHRPAWLIPSTIATMAVSVGTSSGYQGKLASRPRQQYTVSPAPAPTLSTATM